MRRRVSRRRRVNPMVTAIQVVLLIALLVMVIFFRDRIGDGAGALLDSLGSSDLQVQPEPLPPPASSQTSDSDASVETLDEGLKDD